MFRKMLRAVGLYRIQSRAIWRLAENLIAKGRPGVARILFKWLSRRKPRTEEDFYYGALASARVQRIARCMAVLEKGQRAFPGSDSLHSLYVQMCVMHGMVAKYHAVAPTITRPVVRRYDATFELYRAVIAGGATEFFLLKYSDICESCDSAQVSELTNVFFSTLRAHPQSFARAQILVYFARQLDLPAELASKVLEAVVPVVDATGAEMRRETNALRMLDALTLPMVLSGTRSPPQIVRDFTSACRAWAEAPADVDEPLKAMTINWTPWQSLLCAGAPQLYPMALAELGRVICRTWPRFDSGLEQSTARASRADRRNRRIRVGFAVHDSMPMMSGLAARLDARRFETVFLRPGRRGGSRAAKTWSKRVDRTVEFPDHDVCAAIDVIRDQQCDIIVSGPSIAAIFLPFVARLAPLQMVLLEPHWLNGLPNVDYYISWKRAEPSDVDAFYASSVALLEEPPYWIELPPAGERASISPRRLADVRQRLLGAQAAARIYLCASTPPKIHPEMDGALLRILEADPEAVLVLLRSDYPPAQTLKRRLRERLGDHYSRVVFLPTLSPANAHMLLQAADCCLDSFPMTGMSSSFDGAMLGVPIVTLTTDVPFGRWTTSIYEHIGVSELTAKSQEEYVRLAVRLAKDPQWRQYKADEIKTKALRFVENERAVKEFEAFLWGAWDRRVRGFGPAHWVDGRWQERVRGVQKRLS